MVEKAECFSSSLSFMPLLFTRYYLFHGNILGFLLTGEVHLTSLQFVTYPNETFYLSRLPSPFTKKEILIWLFFTNTFSSLYFTGFIFHCDLLAGFRHIIFNSKLNEAYCEDFGNTGSHHWTLDWPFAYFSCVQRPDVAATCLHDHIVGMLWPIDGWHRFDAVSNLSSRSSITATGHC